MSIEGDTIFSVEGPEEEGKPCHLILRWETVTFGDEWAKFNATIWLKDGRFGQMIAEIKSLGGLWFKDDFGGEWFMSWPPAAILVDRTGDHPMVRLAQPKF